MSVDNSEIIDLASEGRFYQNGSELSTGTVELFPITAAEEDLLCSANLLRRRAVLPRILKKLIAKVEDVDSILQCDLETILLNARILNYGASGAVRSTCDSCGESFDHNVSFVFRPRPFDFRSFARGINSLPFTFPVCGKTVTFKLPTWREHLAWEPLGWLEYSKNMTLSVEGEDDIVDFYDTKLRGYDSKAFRDFYEKETPGFFTKWKIKCPNCGNIAVSSVDITTDIFNVKPDSKPTIHSEIFNLCYHTNGAFTYGDVYNMPVHSRSFYIKKLVDLKNEENEQTKKRESEVKAMSKSQPKPTTSSKKR